MNTDTIWTAVKGAVVGAVLTFAGGFWGLGWVGGGTAEEMAQDRAETAVVTALTPFCVQNALSDPDSAAKLAALKEESSYRRDDFVHEAGWATMPGEKEGDRDLAEACAEELEDVVPGEVAKS